LIQQENGKRLERQREREMRLDRDRRLLEKREKKTKKKKGKTIKSTRQSAAARPVGQCTEDRKEPGDKSRFVVQLLFSSSFLSYFFPPSWYFSVEIRQ
jgi:uncharacterized protein YdaU (DUF1376 family)